MNEHSRVNGAIYPKREGLQAETVFVLYDPKTDRYLWENFPSQHGVVFIRGATFFVNRETAEKRKKGRWTEVVEITLQPIGRL